MPATKQFYDAIRPMFGGHFTQSQLEGIEAILHACDVAAVPRKRMIAYMLGTVFHECAKTMQPISEFGHGAHRPYGTKVKQAVVNGHHVPYTTPDQLYYGRGYVQLTWYENYENLGHLIHQDLLNHPDLALQPAIAAQIMIKGMMGGLFTGKGLNKYFTDTLTDWVNARKIINGLDKAELIAGYAQTFYKGLTAPVPA